MTEKSPALGFPVEVSPRNRLSGGPHVFHEANSFAITPVGEPAGQACRDLAAGKACDSDGEGEERDLADASMPTSGCPKGSSAQSSTWHWLEVKDSQQLSQNNSLGWGNCAGSALASVPSGQLRTPDMPTINVACSVNNETDSGKLFLKHPGVPENCPAPLIPTATSIIKEPHFAETLSTHPEQELDWRYATCSYKDGEEAEAQALGRGPSARAGGSLGFPKPSASCPDVLGVDRIGGRLPTEGEIRSCHSDSSKVRLEGKARSPATVESSQVGVFSRRNVADHQSSQTQLVEVKGSSSEWLEQRYLLEHVEGTLEESLMELTNRISMEGNHQWQTTQSPLKNEWQLNSGDPLIPKRSLSQKAGQENADGCQERAEGSLLFPGSEAEPKSARTELKEKGPGPPAEVPGQTGPPRSHLHPDVVAACSVDQPGLSSTPHAPSPDKESGVGAFLENGHNSIHEAPCQFQPSDPEMNSLVSSLPALFPAVTLPERTRPIPEGDQATETSSSGTEKAHSEEADNSSLPMKSVNWEMLRSGAACLPGTRDRCGRAVVIITMRNTIWLCPNCNASEITRLLLYLRSILRPERKALGLTILVDARRSSPVPAVFTALGTLQETIPHCIHRALLLVEGGRTIQVDEPAAVQCELLSSLKSLHKHVESQQLPQEFGGSLPYCHQDWLHFQMRLERLLSGCQEARLFLKEAVETVESSRWPEKPQDAAALLKSCRQMMRMVLDDPRLARWQLEGGALLASLRKEESCGMLSEDCRDAVKVAGALYAEVDEGTHQLVLVSNRRIRVLELLMGLEAVEQCFQEICSWIKNVGEKRLLELNTLDNSLDGLLQAKRQCQDLALTADEYCQRGWEALRRWDGEEDPLATGHQSGCGVQLQEYKTQLQGFCRDLEGTRSRIEQAVELYRYLEQAHKWAEEGMRFLASLSGDNGSAAVGSGLQNYWEQHPGMSDTQFQNMKKLACLLPSSEPLKKWQLVWSQCQRTKRALEVRLEAALRVQQPPGPPNLRPSEEGESCLASPDKRSPLAKTPSMAPLPEKPAQLPTIDTCNGAGGGLRQTACSHSCQLAVDPPKPSCHLCDGGDPLEAPEEAPSSEQLFSRRRLREARSIDLPSSEEPWTWADPSHCGSTGVWIKGLEVSSPESVGGPWESQQPLGSAASPAFHPQEDQRQRGLVPETRSWSSKPQHIMEEMVRTEQEYVRSLRYILDHYFPEMERVDLPQDLRGKRSVIFGNLEKMYNFHSQYFLRELEHCCSHPLRVSHCFLRHKDHFGMYALYSKNKPKSDSLLASHGNAFFRFKQMQLGDKMNLASYLLKPIQRMSKYALLLKDLIKKSGEAQEQELAYLRAAEKMVRFQLRHGNDLLAMDAIRDCDVNLKEQGQLMRQDEFSISLGRRKCKRHIFLFEDLILFSKPKRVEGALDVYVYKRSFKMAEIGLTENSGESGLCFEIWFRRWKSRDTYILQASSPEAKQAWTSDITRILWEQAARNKEIRTQEMLSMGIGNKPFLDIKPSEAAIQDRAINYIMKGRGARTRASIAVSLFDHANPFKSSPATLSAGSPSSCSGIGPLNLHMYPEQALLPTVLPTNLPLRAGVCPEEDEMENETSSQPSMTTEGSESSQGLPGSGSSSSDSCLHNLCEDWRSPLPTAADFLTSSDMEKGCFPKNQYISAV
ncbi:puratrophin-1 isoform X1 [Crotalus tigris]|uniref:puratrophin-1 isoform X1 n=2 Tax=Crotalus tigris TaxID=88082 RepID=UPI00192F14AE|nr:puratrophin-1 isoform X1 [Crotalus tigris]XP_039209503.1 puratrophin-1 isoform X1 [Crotalus tigris]XP_039209504.1 puratrophin-1 isoform X1 [Crotalus tigris]XP_039209505.1 puratrophin-1 isoform X1 [Crotalus tigris]XP_039209506.1 puratrophin-1 isoform X1 [Crotalus tigris]